MLAAWNTLINYLAQPESIKGTYDLAILAGNSLPYLADQLCHLYTTKQAKKIMVVGGIGHATIYLHRNFKKAGYDLPYTSEAEMYRAYCRQKYGVSANQLLIETTSTNSGENASQALNIVKEQMPVPQKVLLLQDPLLQRRIKASFVREWRTMETQFSNYVPKIPKIISCHERIQFEESLFQEAWTTDYFLSLALGEIPRLRNDKKGYGPNGKKFIDAITIPNNVEQAFFKLQKNYASISVRQ